MPIDLAVGENVRQLRRVGRQPAERLVQNILRAGPAAFGPLLDLALDTDRLNEEEPECFGPLHALRLLGELPAPEMIAPLLDKLPLPIYDPDEELPRLWASEVPQMIARLGASGVTPLWEIVDDPDAKPTAHGVAIEALAYTTVSAPEVRDAVIGGLRERLGASDDKVFNAYLVMALGNMGVSDVYDHVMALYREGKIDQQIIAPRLARQLLLTRGDLRLACVKHPLQERYEEHGPFPEQPE
jgi:hypothetical protein